MKIKECVNSKIYLRLNERMDMDVKTDFSLKAFNTFGINAKAKLFSHIHSLEQLQECYHSFSDENKLPLGGGSNILLTKNFDGLVLKLDLFGKEVLREDADYVWIKVGAGEVWHELVLWCVENNWSGIENMSLIPGSVGAAPMQNIGAYGVELKDVFESLEAWLPNENAVEEFSNQQCDFGYRSSIFKKQLKGKAVILNVTFKLSKRAQLNTSYGSIEEELKVMGIDTPTIRDVSNAVIRIRESKLPNPKEIGNAGSFFKNPIVQIDHVSRLLKKYPNIPNYNVGEGLAKVPAGWLIETAGWKGKTFDDRFGIHKKQALVLVNYKNAVGQEILDLSENIIEDIADKFGITLEREVNII